MSASRYPHHSEPIAESSYGDVICIRHAETLETLYHARRCDWDLDTPARRDLIMGCRSILIVREGQPCPCAYCAASE